jgi:hypothetical protein
LSEAELQARLEGMGLAGELAHAILVEITKDHAIVPLFAADKASNDYECGDTVQNVVYGQGLVWVI